MKPKGIGQYKAGEMLSPGSYFWISLALRSRRDAVGNGVRQQAAINGRMKSGVEHG
jgi:hypothetical protein